MPKTVKLKMQLDTTNIHTVSQSLSIPVLSSNEVDLLRYST